jgi:hypothetical protein
MDSQQSYVPRVMRIGSTLGECGNNNPDEVMWFQKMLSVSGYKELTGRVVEVTGTCGSDTIWDQLDQRIKDVVVDIFYQGIRHPASMIDAAITGKAALINFIRGDSSLMNYESSRQRIRYLQ